MIGAAGSLSNGRGWGSSGRLPQPHPYPSLLSRRRPDAKVATPQGFSPATVPEGGYATYGVDGIGMNPDGYPSNNDKTFVDHGFPGCPGGEPAPDPAPSTYTNGMVTPH